MDIKDHAGFCRFVWTPAAISLLFAATCYGQAVAVAEIDGQVLDNTGAVIVGADVKATQLETQTTRTAVTGVQGLYSLPALPVGPYSLEVTSPGFKNYTQSGIVLQVGNNVKINVNLEVGSLSESVKVTADANMVETKNNSISQVIDQQRILDLPLNGRNITQLILVSGAAANAVGGDMVGSKNFYSSATISVGGGQPNSTNYLLDGGDNNDMFSNVNLPFPFPDALQEFSVDASSLPAQNGMHPGGVVNVVTKAGSNTLHGDLFEFLRNGDLNARNFFAATHDNLRRNQFGGTVGGKIIRDKLFFFGGYQGTQTRTAPPQSIAFVPTTAALSGNFSSLESAACQANGKARTIVDPSTGVPFPNSQVPAGRFSSAAVKLEGYLPQTTDPCGKVTYSVPSPSSEEQFIGRIDYARSERHQIFGRYFLVDYTAPAPWNPTNILLTQTSGNVERAQIFTLGDTYTFSPTIVNSLHGTFSRRRDNRGSSLSQISPETLGINTFNAIPNALYLQVANAFNIGCNACSPGHFNVNTFQIADDLNLVYGKHQLALGVDILRSQENIINVGSANGFFQFGGLGSGDPLADFMLGYLSSSSSSAFQQVSPEYHAERDTYPGLYAQDTIHVSSRLTVNLGIRWEPMLFPYDYFGKGASFSMANYLAGQHSTVYPKAPAGLLFYGDQGIPKALTNNKWLDFAPRLGLVWSPTGDGKQTIRVGAARLYDAVSLYYPAQLISAPWRAQLGLTTAQAGPFANPWQNYPGGNPFPLPSPPAPSSNFPLANTYYFMPPDLKPTYVTNWNISYQRQFGADWLATVSYLGSKTTHLWLSQDINSPVSIAGATKGNEAQRRPLYLINSTQASYFSQVIVADDGANATYNALLASVKHRFTHNFTTLVNYTWSHCISDGDSNGDMNTIYYQNQNNRRADRGNCSSDIRHQVNATFVAISPIKGSGWTGRLVRNWQLAPLVRMSTGTPLKVLSGQDNSLTGEGFDRPNLVPGVPVYTSSMGPNLQYLNPQAFAQNATGTFGNLGRNVINYPGAIQVDVALSRSFSLKERLKLEWRAEAFNVINHTNFTGYSANTYGGLTATLTSAQFGRITTAGDPRILQFALKLLF